MLAHPRKTSEARFSSDWSAIWELLHEELRRHWWQLPHPLPLSAALCRVPAPWRFVRALACDLNTCVRSSWQQAQAERRELLIAFFIYIETDVPTRRVSQSCCMQPPTADVSR